MPGSTRPTPATWHRRDNCVSARPAERRLYLSDVELYPVRTYMLKIDFYSWTYLVGCLALAATAYLTYRLFLRLGTKGKGLRQRCWLGCCAPWSGTWCGPLYRGMETILFTALSLALLEYYFSHIAAVHNQAAS